MALGVLLLLRFSLLSVLLLWDCALAPIRLAETPFRRLRRFSRFSVCRRLHHPPLLDSDCSTVRCIDQLAKQGTTWSVERVAACAACAVLLRWRARAIWRLERLFAALLHCAASSPRCMLTSHVASVLLPPASASGSLRRFRSRRQPSFWLPRARPRARERRRSTSSRQRQQPSSRNACDDPRRRMQMQCDGGESAA